jgi:hypothetical protein
MCLLPQRFCLEDQGAPPKFWKRGTVKCKACGADTQIKLTAEMALHFPGLKDIDKPLVWVFPEVLVCLHCGVSEFTVPETELRVLVAGEAEQRKKSSLGSSEPPS